MGRMPTEQPYAYVRRTYGVDPVIGKRVRFTETARDGQSTMGTITRRQSYDQYVYVLFDGERHAVPCHPTSLDYSPAVAPLAPDDDGEDCPGCGKWVRLGPHKLCASCRRERAALAAEAAE